MSRSIHKLTAKQVEKLDKLGRYSDGGNLYVSIAANGGKRWVFLYRFNGRQREMGLGSASLGGVSLARARELATQARVHLQAGEDPLEKKREDIRKNTPVPSFGEWADQYVETHRKSWRNAKHAAQWSMTLTKYCAAIRSIPVNAISTDDVLTVLQPLWTSRPETAQRLRGRIENVLDSAKAKGHRSGENPARWKGHLQNLLPKPKKLTRGHHAALPFAEVPDFMEELSQRGSIAARALEFAILTACRTGEVLNAVWEEIDLDGALWIIPAERTKAGKQHRVPLSEQVIDVLNRLNSNDMEGHVFPGQRRNKPLSSMAMAMQLRRMNRNTITVHGFRSSFRDWASETTSFPQDVCELALAHAIANQTEAAYRRGDLLEKRTALMKAWAEYCYKTTDANVIQLTPTSTKTG